MQCKSEAELKPVISGDILPVYLLYGNEPLLITAYKKKLLARLCQNGEDADVMDGRQLDLSAFFDAAQLLSMFGGRRVILIDNLDISTLTDADIKDICAFLPQLTEDVSVVITVCPYSFDEKKGGPKKLIAAAEKTGAAACLNKRAAGDLKTFIKSRCKKQGVEISHDAASFMLEHCGSDLSLLCGECDKLCAYCREKAIAPDEESIRTVCSGSLTADPFAVARLMLAGNSSAVMRHIDALFRLREAPLAILSNISYAFCDIARACCAVSCGKTADAVTKDFAYRFPWKVQNAFRSCRSLNMNAVFEVCQMLCDAENLLKSSGGDERIIIEAALMRCMQTLQRGKR